MDCRFPFPLCRGRACCSRLTERGDEPTYRELGAVMDVSSGPGAAHEARRIRPESLCCGKAGARAPSSPGYPQGAPGTYRSATECHVDQRNAMKWSSDPDSPCAPVRTPPAHRQQRENPGQFQTLENSGEPRRFTAWRQPLDGQVQWYPERQSLASDLMRRAGNRDAGCGAGLNAMEKAIRLTDGLLT